MHVEVWTTGLIEASQSLTPWSVWRLNPTHGLKPLFPQTQTLIILVTQVSALTVDAQGGLHPVKQYRSIMYYRSLAVQKMAGVPGTAAKIQRIHSMGAHDAVAHANSKNFTVADLEGMGKSMQKVFLKSAEYSVLESVGEARWERGHISVEEVWGVKWK